MKNEEPFPKHLREHYDGWREYKICKRGELKDILRDFNDFRFGSAWLPLEAFGLSREIDKKLAELRELLSQRNWGR